MIFKGIFTLSHAFPQHCSVLERCSGMNGKVRARPIPLERLVAAWSQEGWKRESPTSDPGSQHPTAHPGPEQGGSSTGCRGKQPQKNGIVSVWVLTGTEARIP